MKYRNLRIAWSVGWGLLCLLLIALWVRSYWHEELIAIPVGASRLTGIGYVHGTVTAFWAVESTATMNGPIIQSFPSGPQSRFERSPRYRGKLGFGVAYDPLFIVMGVPIWFCTMLTALLVTLPWMGLTGRFRLRTLLIVMTVVAGLLGLIVWASNNS